MGGGTRPCYRGGTLMKDYIEASLKLQKQILDAQQASIDAQRASLKAGQKALGAGDAFVKMQEVGQQMAKANLEAIQTWTKLWSVWM